MKFSIITPTYNRAHTIERAIKSILKQSYSDFELIIIDDGSSDNTEEIVKKYLSDKRIRYIGPNNNGGVNVARNIGLNNISEDTQWITFLDSDDEFLFDSLEKMKKVIESNMQYNYFRFSVVYSDGSTACYAENNHLVLNYEETLKQKKVSGEWVVTFNKKILDKGFLFEESVNAYESISWYALAKKELCFHSLETVRIYQLDTEGLQRQSTKGSAYYNNVKKAITLYLDLYGEDLKKYNKNDYILKLFMLSYTNLKLKEYTSFCSNLIKSIVFDPFNTTIWQKIYDKFFIKK